MDDVYGGGNRAAASDSQVGFQIHAVFPAVMSTAAPPSPSMMCAAVGLSPESWFPPRRSRFRGHVAGSARPCIGGVKIHAALDGLRLHARPRLDRLPSMAASQTLSSFSVMLPVSKPGSFQRWPESGRPRRPLESNGRAQGSGCPFLVNLNIVVGVEGSPYRSCRSGARPRPLSFTGSVLGIDD